MIAIGAWVYFLAAVALAFRWVMFERCPEPPTERLTRIESLSTADTQAPYYECKKGCCYVAR